MNIGVRIILWVYALAVALASAAVLVIWSGLFDFGSRSPLYFDETAIIAVIFLIFSLFFLVYRSRPVATEPQTITHRMDNGDVKISYEALEQLVSRAASRVRGVQNLQARVRQGENGMKILVRYSIEADLDIPKTTEELQAAVKSYVEATSGVPVDDVTVYVTELDIPKDVVKKRVE